MGDVKLAGVMGVYLGRAVAPALLVGFLAGALFGLALIARARARRHASRRCRSARSSRSAASSACSPATRSSTGTSDTFFDG